MRNAIKIQKITTRPAARQLDQIDISVWGSKDPRRHHFFEYFLGYGMRVYRATVGGRLAGALVTGYPTSANLMEIEEIMVAKEFREKGVGKKLLAFARREARQRGHQGIVVEVDAKNRHALRWYKKRGMKTVGWVVVDNQKAWADEERVIKGGK